MTVCWCSRRWNWFWIGGAVITVLACNDAKPPSGRNADIANDASARDAAADSALDAEPPSDADVSNLQDAGLDSGDKQVSPRDGGAAQTTDPAELGPAARQLGMACANDTDCDNRDFCDGAELCVEDVDDSSRKVCARGWPPCAAEACSREQTHCDCDFRGGDADGDNHRAADCAPDGRADCDDGNPNIHPGATEACDAVDDDCDPSKFGELDADLDTFVSVECRNLDVGQRRWNAGGDLDDARDDVHPKATEKCDGVDNDCDSWVDEAGDRRSGGIEITFYLDRDGDGFGDAKATGEEQLTARCSTPPDRMWSLQATDCNDGDALVHPGRAELCNGYDDDCDRDRLIDEPPFDQAPDFTATTLECRGAAGWVITNCPPVTENCDQDVSNGCEKPLDTLCNCRSCGSSCRFACGASECEEITSVAVGGSHSCAITGARGEIVACWGANHRGQLGDDSINLSALPKRVERLTGVVQVAAGGSHSCGIAADGGGLFCWGDDSAGQLGAPATDDHAMIPVPVGGLSGGVLRDVASIATGAAHSCAILITGKLACWGQGDDGRLGDRLADEHIAPAPVETFRAIAQEPIQDAKQVVAGYAHTCLLTTGGAVECAGDNGLLQLGDGGSSANSSIFRPVPGLDAVDELSAGSSHTCARTRGRVFCWGSNAYGQLGVALSSNGLPTRVEGLETVRSIAVGGAWSCAIDGQDVVRCWGSNVYGELGNSDIPVDFEPHPTPGVIGLGTARAIFGGYGSHVCALAMDGRAVCWGGNDAGELGNGDAAQGGMPVEQNVRALSGSVSCGQ